MTKVFLKTAGSEFDLDAVINLMDRDITEQLHSSQSWDNEQQFVDAYCAAHEEKYNEDFIVN